jgi:16S rRNA (guanine527-N7)-methyltransferase
VEHVTADALVTSPETLARTLFGERWPLAEAYVERLASVGVERGLLGPREGNRLWDRHILNCAALAPLLDAGQVVGDLGSGAGLPGIVIALLRPDVTVELVEPLERRALFLQETVDLLGLSCPVVRARAEDLVGQRTYDVVTARAVAPLDRLVGWALPLLEPGGQLLAIKGTAAEAELATAQGTLTRLGARSAEVLTLNAGQPGRAWVVRVVAGQAPRRVIPRRRHR